MKKKIFFSLGAVAIAAVTIIACKRNFDNKFDARSTFAGTISECCDSLGTATLSGVYRANRLLSCDTVYKLDGKVYFDDGAVLTIEEGTVIRGVPKATPALASALIITKGSKISANGSASCPIIFTSDKEDPAPGDWGGVVLLGQATVNAGNSGIIEGIQQPSVPAGVDITYGGSTDNDSSGVMRYVRIEYAGASIATDNELNGLTCGGVGNKTVLDFIEVYRGNDDAFEFFGGTVNAKHLVSYEADDDAFDFDLGYTGCIQFAVSVLTPGTTYSSNPNGIESDNDATGSNAMPRTAAKISNMTVIGLSNSTQASSAALLSGAHLRRNSSYLITNSIFMGFRYGMTFDTSGSLFPGAWKDSALANRDTNNLIHGYDVATRLVPQSPAPIRNMVFPTGITGTLPSWLAQPFDATGYDFRPASGSPAASGAKFAHNPGCWQTAGVTYRGAFGTTNWMAGWTKTPTDL